MGHPRFTKILHRRGILDVASRPDQLRLTPDERADLVAYVDGELPEGHAQTIATKLTKSATARREVEMLQKTWEMLDYLALPQATEHFSSCKVVHGNRFLPLGPPAWVGLPCILCSPVCPSGLATHWLAGCGLIRQNDWFMT
jgi:hypothetical protein